VLQDYDIWVWSDIQLGYRQNWANNGACQQLAAIHLPDDCRIIFYYTVSLRSQEESCTVILLKLGLLSFPAIVEKASRPSTDLDDSLPRSVDVKHCLYCLDQSVTTTFIVSDFKNKFASDGNEFMGGNSSMLNG
jgi:hypothetical protein